MDDLALLHSHCFCRKGRQSLWKLARRRKVSPGCSGALWGEERGARAVRLVYPATPLQAKAPEGPDTLEEGRESPRLSGKLVGTQGDGAGWAGQGLGLGQPQVPPAPVHLLCFIVWAVVVLTAWFQGGRCPDLPPQEYQAIQLGSYPCPGTQAGPPGVIGTESPTPHPPRPPLYSSNQ